LLSRSASEYNISALLNSFQMGYDRRVRPNYGGKVHFLKPYFLMFLATNLINSLLKGESLGKKAQNSGFIFLKNVSLFF